MKKIIVTLGIFLGFQIYADAQEVSLTSKNETIAKSFDGQHGYFSYKITAQESISINYSLSPLHPSTDIHFTVSTADPRLFWATIKDESNKVVYTWRNTELSNVYISDWNIAFLKKGKYSIDIYTDSSNESIYQTSFTKD
ncbi:MAG: hypothetical protein QM530_08735 [Phycisphaerales bacterium]|nr:hypothetical protein [Phycisphaerales bacterium]